MGSLYKPEEWHDLFVVIGTSAGALVGLLFVVMSLHFGKISERADHNMRATIDGARYNTIHLLVVLVEAAVVLTPQPLVEDQGMAGVLAKTFRGIALAMAL